MDTCDVLIVGAGPAGSACAWKLRHAGIDVLLIDKATFPRNKVCGGWITPAVLEELQIDPRAYARNRVLQPLTGFRTSFMGGTEVETNYGKPISYGIRRVEFDEFVLSRCDARILQGVSLTTLDRIGDCWVANGEIHARLVIGAGGHFCPVARLLGAASSNDTAVVAQEGEFEMTPAQMRSCSIQPELPELYFCHDMRGYGWCFRKEKYLNIGLGRMDPRSLPMHVAGFLDFLRASGKIGFALPGPMQGHAYLLHGRNRRTIVGERFLLIGDAAGVAYSQSGEGIRPAIESGLLAAETIIAANGKYNVGTLKGYPGLLAGRFGGSGDGWLSFVGSYLPDVAIQALAKGLLANKWITRHVVLDHWFLRTHEPALSSVCTVPS